MAAFDYKKAYPEFYLPPRKPHLIEIPQMNFMAIRGEGDPNEAVNLANLIVSDGSYFAAMGSYTSSCAMAAAPVFEEADMVLFSPTGSHEEFPLMSPITFGIGISRKYDCASFSNEVARCSPGRRSA